MDPWLLGVGGALVLGAMLVWSRLRPRPLGKLSLREGATLGLEFPIVGREITIGSEDGQTVAVSHPRVSRQHAMLSLEKGEFVLRNRSRNGTTVNGEPVEEAALHSGDLICLGGAVELIFTRH
jgi:pSer/pThr/pTyr-binding forkhead associated (FHA) protein